MSDFDFLADILTPPEFKPSGVTKVTRQAVADEDWLGSVQFWLYMRDPEPSLLYQQRLLTGAWAPGKLDVAAAGYYRAGETGLAGGLRELTEELGIQIPQEKFQFFGRKINVNVDNKHRERRSVSDIFFAEFTGGLDQITMPDGELEGVFVVPLAPLLEVFCGNLDSFEVQGRAANGQPATYTVNSDSFPYNFDDYHRRMAEFFALKLGVSNAYLGN